MKHFLLLVLLTMLFQASSPAKSDNGEISRVRELYEQRKFGELSSELERRREQDPVGFTSGFYGYLFARAAESDRKTATAFNEFQKEVRHGSNVSSNALNRLSASSRSTGNLTLERIYLKKLDLYSNAGSSRASVKDRLARSGFESGRYAESIQMILALFDTNLRRTPSRVAEVTYARELRALLADAYHRNGLTDLARETYLDLIDGLRDNAQPDSAVYYAVKGLDLIDIGGEDVEKWVGKLDESQHLKRAQIYHINRDFVNARFHFQNVVSQRASIGSAAEALFQIGRGYSMSSDHVEAITWYERLLERYPSEEIAGDAQLQVAASYTRVGKPNEAITRYQDFIERNADHPKVDRAYLNLVDLYRDLGEDQEALKWCTRTEEVFRGKVPAAAAVFAAARIKIARDEWKDALDLLDRLITFAELGGSSIPGGTYPSEVAFLRGYSLENLKRYNEAVDIYLSITDSPGNYYGWVANKRLTELRETEPAGTIIAQKVLELADVLKGKHTESRRLSARKILRLSNSPSLRDEAAAVLASSSEKLKADNLTRPKTHQNDIPYHITSRPGLDTLLFSRLAALGIHDDAATELETQLTGKLPSNDKEAYLIAEAFVRGSRGDLAIAAIDAVSQKPNTDGPLEFFPERYLRVIYPSVYGNVLLRESQKYGVDPRLILAIMKQESGFQPAAHSSASARGLMQFIPSTADRVSIDLQRSYFVQDDLYSPSTGITFGSHYLGGLFKSFPGQPEAVVASYNGGDDNMKRWLARSRSRVPERYVPEIMFTQTKDYVYRVMTNYWTYQTLYNDDLSPR